ncbi:MAG: glucosaminidase domain-containing protein [Bacteroidales bacterium]|jgi:LysM repeat protein|nr:glucosaminidase domain-containing protein [Bacteroidales bacterium]
MKLHHIIFNVLFFFGIFSLNAQQKITTEKYINTYKDLAIKEMGRSGIPASITLAQGILESASGNSRLAVKANNHFGIKCHDWEGNRIFHDDDAKGECFRHYKNAEESFLDHTDFLMTRSRYAFLFEYQHTDYKNWAKGLRKAGYATDPKYPQLLIDLIERYDLHQYDTGASVSKKSIKKTQKGSNTSTVQKTPKEAKSIDNFSVSVERYQVKENNGTNFVVAKNGDTYASLTKEMDMMPWQLPKYNETHASTPLSEGQVIYLQPKRRKAERGMDVHVLQDGETMYDVSQKYGIRLKRLYILNRMEEGTEPPAGTQLNLRKKKKNH